MDIIRTTVFALSVLLAGCMERTNYVTDTASPAGPSTGDSDEPDTQTEPEPQDTGESVSAENSAIFVSADFPSTLSCGESTVAELTLRNNGTSIWNRDTDYKLGAVNDEDPFKPGDVRVWLDESDSVSPGEPFTFEIELDAGDEAGTWTTDWQMVQEAVEWFGDVASYEIEVACEETPVEEADTFDLNDVTWLHSDVSGWSQTATLSSVTVSGDEICLNYNKADTWTVTDYGDVEVVANPWVFIWQNDQWYAGTWEWLRPGQTCKNVDSVAGSHITQDPFGEHDGWVPTSGETFYFMVSGLARTSLRNVEERSNVVQVVWP